MNENQFETRVSALSDDLENGLHSIIYKRVGAVTINDKYMRNAFTLFVGKVECGKTISAAEILYSAEALIKGGSPNENAGNHIYCFENAPADSKLIKNSVAGIYSLFSLHNGMSLDLDAAGGSLASAELKRFLIMPPKKAEKLVSKAHKFGIKATKAGQMLSANKIILTRSGIIEDSVDRSVIDTSSPSTAITLGSEHFSAFLSGYLAVCSLTLSNCVSSNNVIRFGLGGGLEFVFARALGFFVAALQLKSAPVRMLFTSDNSASVAVSRPNVVDGDYFYLLKLRVDEKGIPDKSHLAQLLYYLTEKKRVGIIKDVLPVKENIEGLIKRLGSKTLVYESLVSVPENGYGIIVSVNRGESVNGVKLGYFKNN